MQCTLYARLHLQTGSRSLMRGAKEYLFNKNAFARTEFMLRREASSFAKLTLCHNNRKNLHHRLQRSAKSEPCFRIFMYIFCSTLRSLAPVVVIHLPREQGTLHKMLFKCILYAEQSPDRGLIPNLKALQKT